MTTHKNLMTLCVAAVFAVGLAACGGGGGNGDGPDTGMDDTDTGMDDTDTGMDDTDTGMDEMMVDLSGVTPGYGTITAGTVTIPGGETMDRGDVGFKCAEGVDACEVTVADDGTVMSTGGKVTAMNSAAYNMKIADAAAEAMEAATEQALAVAMAINTPMPAGNSNGVPAGATITRTTDGEHKITLMNTPSSGTDLDPFVPVYKKSEMMTPQAKGWYAETQTRTPRGQPAENAVTYTDIRSAKAQKLVYDNEGADDNIPAIGATNVIVLNDDKKLAYSGGDRADTTDDESVMGTINGIPGTFTCVADTCNVTFNEDPGPGGQDGTVSTITGEGWTFESTDYVESEATLDGDYLYFGYWLQEADEDDNYAFATFSGGSERFTQDRLTAIQGSATYQGAAAGKYVMKELGVIDGKLEPVSAVKGQFTATAELTADFGDGSEMGEIEGSVTDFLDGTSGKDLGFHVNLRSADIGSDGTWDDGEVSATHGTIPDESGGWTGALFGDVLEATHTAGVEADATDAQQSAAHPRGVAGTFNAHFSDGHVAGGYGATR